MVSLVPRDRFVLQTTQSVQTVMQRLEAHLEPPKTLRWSFDTKHAPYEGAVSESGCTMRRIPRGRNNGCIPKIKGRFETHSGGTVVHLTLTLHPALLIFLGCWSLLWFSFTPLMWFSGSMDSGLALQLLVMPFFVFVFLWLTFWLEVERCRNDLQRFILGRQTRSRQKLHQMLLLLQGGFIVLSVVFSLLSMSKHLSESQPGREVPEALRSQQASPSHVRKDLKVNQSAAMWHHRS